MNFNELLGGVGKDFMNAAQDALVGAAKEYLGNAIQEIFVKKEADTKRTLTNIQHMKVVSSPVVRRVLLRQRIMCSVWRLLGDMARQRIEYMKWDNGRGSRCGGNGTSLVAPRDNKTATYGSKIRESRAIGQG